MSQTLLQNRELMDWGVAARPIPGEEISGDLHVVKAFDHGVLLAAIDGVGHGSEATTAARVAAAVLEKHASEPVVSLVRRCHDALARTRGVVLTLASLNALEDRITWLGVGNVEGRIWHANPRAAHHSECVLLRGGLVGFQLPALMAGVVPVAPGDLLVLATDGVRSDFTIELDPTEAPRDLAARILDRHFKENDDALVLAARYLGVPHE